MTDKPRTTEQLMQWLAANEYDNGESSAAVSESVYSFKLRELFSDMVLLPAESAEPVAWMAICDEVPIQTAIKQNLEWAARQDWRVVPLYTHPSPAQPADADTAHIIACALAAYEGYDPDDKHGGLYDVKWSGGSEPEPLGDLFSLEYLPRAERIVAALNQQPGGPKP